MSASLSAIDPALSYAQRPQLHQQPASFTGTSAVQQPAPDDALPQPYFLPPGAHQHQPLAGALDPALEARSVKAPPPEDTPDDHVVPALEEQPHDEPGSAPANPASDAKRPRACDSCRGLKVRCDQDPSRPDVPCKRCAKANRLCITTPPTRKRQKKADSRVAELERKIDALTATLEAHRGDGPSESGQYAPDPPPSGLPYDSVHPQLRQEPGTYNNAPQEPVWPDEQGRNKRRRLDIEANQSADYAEDQIKAMRREVLMSENAEIAAEAHDYGRSARPFVDHSNLIRKIDELLDPGEAERIFDRYVREVSPCFPAVPFPPNTTAEQIRTSKPLLFLSILAGTSYGINVRPEIQRELWVMLNDEFANALWRNAEKSLEIVQALQVGVLWYRPPSAFEQHNFYQMANTAAVMALDLGLGKRVVSGRKHPGSGPYRRCLPHQDSVEARRAWLVCYFLCMSITMALRRPILLRWTKYMDECIKALETSPDALLSDRALCQHVRTIHICEDVSVQFSMDDPNTEISISDAKVQYSIKTFENQLKDLSKHAPYDSMVPVIKYSEHVANLYIHEIALHHSSNLDSFGAGCPLSDSFSKGEQPSRVIGPAHVAALSECLSASHGILDTFLTLPYEVVNVLPTVFSVRAIYSLVCLIKMWVAVTNPASDMGTVIRKEDLRLEHYLGALRAIFGRIKERDEMSPHNKFVYVVGKLNDTFTQLKEGLPPNTKTPWSTSRGQDAGNPAQTKRRSKGAYAQQHGQTPLHLLSEVATVSNGNQPPSGNDASVGSYLPPQTQQSQWYQPPQQQQQQQVAPVDMQGYDFGGSGQGMMTGFDFSQLGMNLDLFQGDILWTYPGDPFAMPTGDGGFM
ncbi:hypothetical protein W97_06628 [Coniosporium apollinis CBS 100218]|uniref:Zn(2)-C6 fungal-type domain-containing protein n=1 Tax=Coniosporium apollinis (strain CBS 100218) TaxID=1168221 RepID=R7YZI7_CONA1|nr:uncharacterized protein W97_06628 [Coniosporium apollinis CBS 100218]EON67375.1 hypothetical protein W97_06628 [Coniosporium apollinis CBS 100218]